MASMFKIAMMEIWLSLVLNELLTLLGMVTNIYRLTMY